MPGNYICPVLYLNSQQLIERKYILNRKEYCQELIRAHVQVYTALCTMLKDSNRELLLREIPTLDEIDDKVLHGEMDENQAQWLRKENVDFDSLDGTLFYKSLRIAENIVDYHKNILDDV